MERLKHEGQIWSFLIPAASLASCMTLANLLNYTEPFFICKHTLLFLVKTLVALWAHSNQLKKTQVVRIFWGSKNKNNYAA